MIVLNRPLVFFDLETTGVNTATDRIVQFAAIKIEMDGDTPKQVAAVNIKINPEMPIPRGASEVHGIYDKDVKACMPFMGIAFDIARFMSGCDWAGYNSNSFDVPLLLNEFARCNTDAPQIENLVDVFKIFKEDLPHTLMGAHKHYVGKTFEGAHDALADVEATMRIFFEQTKLDFLPTTTEEISDRYKIEGQLDIAGKLKLNKKGKVVFTFGKHKDKPVMETDEGYLKWCKKSNVLNTDAWDIIRKLYKGEEINGS